MNIENIFIAVLTIGVIVTVIIFNNYVNHRKEIDEKALKGNRVAQSQKMIAQVMQPLVFQAEKNGGKGDEKLKFVLDQATKIVTDAGLPKANAEFMRGQAEKSVALMKQTQDIIDTGKAINDEAKKGGKVNVKNG